LTCTRKNFGPDLPYYFTYATFGQLLVVTILLLKLVPPDVRFYG